MRCGVGSLPRIMLTLVAPLSNTLGGSNLVLPNTSVSGLSAVPDRIGVNFTGLLGTGAIRSNSALSSSATGSLSVSGNGRKTWMRVAVRPVGRIMRPKSGLLIASSAVMPGVGGISFVKANSNAPSGLSISLSGTTSKVSGLARFSPYRRTAIGSRKSPDSSLIVRLPTVRLFTATFSLNTPPPEAATFLSPTASTPLE